MTCFRLPMTSRRSVLGGAAAFGLLPTRAFAAPATSLIAGTYANEGGGGLVPLTASGEGWASGTAIGTIRNSSFGVKGRRGLHYLLDEQRQGSVSVHDGAYRNLGTRSTQGRDPCHAALNADETMLAVANYSSGSVALWRLDPATGLPQGAGQHVVHAGSGPDKARQAGPHAHWVGFTRDGGILHSVDLGADAIFAHRIDGRRGGIATTSIAYQAAPGSGPRHLAHHPRLPVAYLVAELANTVTMLRAGADGAFTQGKVVSTLPQGFSGASAAAHIALNRTGTRLYVSNRGHDSIAVFAIEADGALSLLQHVGCGGHWPRFFLLMEQRRELLVANERSGQVAGLQIEADGRLRTTGRSVAVPGVVFLAV
jgi:6-phosphogluconolactonase